MSETDRQNKRKKVSTYHKSQYYGNVNVNVRMRKKT